MQFLFCSSLRPSPRKLFSDPPTSRFDGSELVYGKGTCVPAKMRLIAEIPPAASVIAPLPYLSHLAMREKLYSLHYILKGLKTLSRASFQPPPPTDFVLIDYRDTATFDASAGYYHPAMKTIDGPSHSFERSIASRFPDAALVGGDIYE